MKHASRAAYGGLLTAASVVLLALASAFSPAGWALCICAGLAAALPLSHGQARLGVLVYVATSVLAAVIVPGKRYALAYILLFGLYPLVKYGIERMRKRPLEWALKLGYACVLGAAVWLLLTRGLLAAGGWAAGKPPMVLAALALAAFGIYDIFLSRCIALLGVLFGKRPPDARE